MIGADTKLAVGLYKADGTLNTYEIDDEFKIDSSVLRIEFFEVPEWVIVRKVGERFNKNTLKKNTIANIFIGAEEIDREEFLTKMDDYTTYSLCGGVYKSSISRSIDSKYIVLGQKYVGVCRFYEKNENKHFVWQPMLEMDRAVVEVDEAVEVIGDVIKLNYDQTKAVETYKKYNK